MPFDAGGLSYTLKIDDQASASIQAIIAQINELRAAASGLGQGFGSLRGAAEEARTARRSFQDLTKEIDAETAGFRRNAAAAKNLEISLHAQSAALETGVAALRSKIKAESEHEEGLRRAAAAMRRQNVEEVKAQALAQAGFQTLKQKAAALEQVAAAQREANRAQQESLRLQQESGVGNAASDLQRRRSSAEFAQAEAKAREAETKALRENIELRNQARLERPDARSGLSQERTRQEAEAARAEAVQDEKTARRKQEILREDILAREEAARERVRLAAEAGRAEAAIDEANRKKQLAALRADIQARAALEGQGLTARQQLLAQSPQAQAQALIAADQARLERARAVLTALERGQNVLPATVRRARAEVTSLTEELTRTERAGNRISFTFRRLFGILAAFTLAREGLRLFQELITGGIKFNAALEQAEISIASIVAATGDLRDINGQMVEGAQAFAAAQKESRRQMQLLRADSLRTSSSLQDLVFAFQTAIGPGLQAGLNLDDVRRFSVQISQAATAIGLSQNQLAEEIRSILQGTIQTRTTRIATVLGISNEDIKRAKEAGRLVEFLNARFQAFSRAAEEGSNNLTNIFARLRNAIGLVLGGGSEQLFARLRDGLKDILDTLVEVRGDTVLINPKAVAVVREIQNGLADALQIVLQLRESFSFEGALESARAVGDIFRSIATIAKPFIDGISQGFRDIAKVLKPLTSFFSGAAGTFIGTLLGQLVRILTVVGSIGLALKAFFLPISATIAVVGSLRNQFLALKTSIDASTASSGKLRTSLQGIAAAATIGLLFGQVDRSIKEARKIIDNFFKEKLPAEAEITAVQAGKILTSSARAVAGLLSEEEFKRHIIDFRREIINEFNKTTNATVKPGSLLDIIDELPVTIARTLKETDALKKALEDLGFDRQEANLQLATFLEAPGASGASAQIAQDRARAQVELERKGRELAGQRAEIEGRISTEKSRQSQIDEKIVKLQQTGGREALDTLELFLLSAKSLAELQKQLATAQASGADTSDLEEQIRGMRENIDQIISPVQVRSGIGEQLREIATAQLTLDAERITNQDQLNSVKNTQLALEQAIFGILRVRSELIAGQELQGLKDQNEQLRIRLDAEDRIANARLSRLELLSNAPLRTQAAEAQNQLEERQLANKQALAKVSADIARLEADKQASTGNISQVEQLITAKIAERNLLLREQVGELARMKQLLADIQSASGNFAAEFALGLKTAFAQFKAAAPDTFQSFLKAGTTALEGVVSVGREAFASIFDPNSNFSIREALGRLLLEIGSDLFADSLRNLISGLAGAGAQEVVAAETSAAILVTAGEAVAASMITGATTAAGILAGGSATSAAFATTAGNPISFFGNRGGRVPQYRRRGGRINGQDRPVYRARGGFGLHPGAPRGRDTVPAWLEPREWVVRARSAQLYGQRAMAAINEGLIDPTSLRALAATSRARTPAAIPPATAPISRASGGSVPSGGGSTQILPVAVTDQKMFELLLTQGEGQLMRFLADRGVPIGQR